MAQIYEIRAYSPSRNETQREFDQDSLEGRHTTDARIAQMKAESFASRIGARFGAPNDWVAQVVLIDTIA